MGIIAAGQITVVDLSDAPVLNAFITASRPTTQTYSKDSRNYNPSYASTPQVLTLNVTKSGSTTSIIDSISGLHWFVVDGSVKTEITSKVNTSNEYISGNNNENLTTKLNIDTNKGYRRYEATGVWRDPSTDLDVQFSANIDLLLTQNGATGPQGPQGDDGPQGPQGETGNGIANTVVTYGLSMTDTTEPATWSSERPALVKGMYLWTRTVIIYTNGESTTSYQISYIPKDGDATGEIDKTKQELLEKLETVRDDSLAAVEEAKQQLVTVRDESLAAAEEAKQQVTTVADDLSKAKTDFQNAVNTVDTKATNVQNDLSKAKQDLASQAQQLREQANAQSELTNRVSSVEETTNGTKTTVSELSKTVDQNSKNITSVTARTKIVEDDLSGTKTTLSQVKTTADSTSQKTATLESGLNGLNAKFSNLKIGGRNLLTKTNQGKTNWDWSISSGGTTAENYYVDGVNAVKLTRTANASASWSYIQYQGLLKNLIEPDTEYTLSFDVYPSKNVTFTATLKQGNSADPFTNDVVMNQALANKWTKVFCTLTSKETLPSPSRQVVYLSGMPIGQGNYLIIKNIKLEKGNVATDYSPSDADVEQKVAEYKQTADQNYASLSSTVQNLDGTVQHNKTVAEQTAEGFKTRIESLETYKSGESTRANQYFELAKTETARQLSVERTAIAKDYVAKSTYTSDVTGIRNELSATTITANTTKQNLASYQATNDRVVANLQSNIQTANGDISSLKTKVEAVPGQITSAVSSVESKIPTEIGSSNLLRKTTVNADNLKLFETSNSTISVITKDGHQTYKIVVSSSNGSGVNFKGNDQYYNLIKDRTYTFSFWVLTNKNKDYNYNSLGHIQAVNNNSDKVGSDVLHQHTSPVYSTSVIKANTWTKVWCTFKATSNSYFKPFFWYLTAGDEIYIYDMMLNEGKVPLSYTSAPEDAAEQISSLSSQIKQTADGITLLATKTELSSAKNELQSGINTATNKANAAQSKANSNAQTISTHTTQISALNTGLSAKVSQSDFNTLSGRVTTAENNIVAKANELSSKITSVEGKIPTSVGTVNLVKGTGSAFVMGYGITNTTWNETKKQSILDFSAPGVRRDIGSEILPQGDPFFKFKPIKGVTYTQSIMIDTDATFNPNGQAQCTWFTNKGHNQQKAYIKKVGDYSYQVWSTYTWNLDDVALRAFDWYGLHSILLFRTTGTYLAFYKPKLTVGNLPSDWSPSPEDYDDAITRVSSEIKQTADGITLLATKTELNTAKNELQSGINTATNKANNAQTTANNNAQTIRTHTTQISALNTGLSAKVSQSDFNTLSGRVTTAENNITAKANELSSKITAVEGKIPTEMGSSNLLRNTAVNTDNLKLFETSNSTINVVTKDRHQTYKIVVSSSNGSGVNFKGNARYYNLIKDRIYTFSFWVLTNKNKNYNFNSLGHIQAINENGDLVGSSDSLHQHSNPIYSTNTIKANTWTKVWCTFKATSNSYFRPFFWYLTAGDEIYIYDMMLNEGKVPLSYTSAPEDTINQISSLSSEFKQTTDSIKASVSSLDKSTVKSSSLTINADGIVMKAGKSTTDVANAIGSYFSVNQNAINLFSDKIKVKGNMIVSGSISSDKISSSGITANVIKGGTLQSTNGSTNFELNTGKLFYNNNNTGVFRVQNGASTMGLKFSNTSLTVNGTSRILSRTILGGDRRETTLDDGKWDKGGFSGLVIETIKGVEPATNEHADALRAISDTIYFTHTYSADSPTGVSAHGWKMETYAPNSSYSGNIVLKPYGINYRQSDIIVGDIRLDNGDGSGYWVRATINTLKACFGHILNGGTSSQALNAIRSELNKISGT